MPLWVVTDKPLKIGQKYNELFVVETKMAPRLSALISNARMREWELANPPGTPDREERDRLIPVDWRQPVSEEPVHWARLEAG